MKAISTSDSRRINRTELVNSFLADARRQRVYNAEEQKELAVKAQNGDLNARNQLIAGNSLFIFSVCSKYANGDDILDLVSIASLGMIDAVDKYDVSKGYNFISYAVHAMRDKIYQYINADANLIVNKSAVKLSKKVADIKESFYQFAERYPSNEEIVALLKEDGIDSNEYQVESIFCNSFSEVIGDDDATNEECGDIAIATATSNEYEGEVENEQNAMIIAKCMSALTNTEREIVEKSLGLGREYAMVDEDIAIEYGVSAERIRQIKKGALAKLRAMGDKVARAM